MTPDDMEPGKATPPDGLRRQAEEAIAAQPDRPAGPLSHDEALALVHELQVHQIELELQNEELLRTRREAEALRDRYADLYDFAPVGYFTLDEAGAIREANLAGAVQLGVERGSLIGAGFVNFLNFESRPGFAAFCARVLAGGTTETCDVSFAARPGHEAWYAQLRGRADAAGAAGFLRLVVTDITERRRAEDALREREQTLQSILRAAPVGIGIASDRVIGSANEHLCRMTGYAEEELIGQDARMLYPSDEAYASAGQEKYGQILANGIGAVETQWRRKDGRVIDILLSSSPMDPSTPFANVVFVALDITDLHENEAALRESEAKYRNAVELSPDAIVIHQDGLIVFANPAAAALVGAGGPDALEGRPILDLVHPGTRELAAASIELDLRGEESPVTAIEILRDDGTTVPAQGRGAAIPFGGRPAVQVILRDVTAARQAQQALRESEANMARAQSTAHLGNWAWDLATNVISCSDEHCRLYGLAPGDYPIETFINLVHEDDRQSIRDALAASLETGTPYDVECRVVRPDGVERVLHGEGEAVRDRDGRVTGMFGIAQDITERKEAEEALREYAEDLRRSNEDLERFAYVSSHDLQEPLRSIVSFSQLLERRYRGQLGQDADEYIDFIVEGGNRMQALIQDLLAYSRVNTTRQELRPTDTEEVLAAVERNLAPQLREAGAVITHGPLPMVLADPLQLEQVLMNLVSNAIKFHRPDEPLRIHVGARRTDGFWEFSVRDNGVGIEQEYFEKIFVIFQRLHTKDAYPGTGIGLAIVKRIIDRHGGTIRVESVPGEGSTFFFTLPAA